MMDEGLPCDGHVWVAASGFGLRVIPKSAPYHYLLSPSTPAHLDVERYDGRRWLFARVVPHEGGYTSKLAEGTAALADVLDVVAGPEWDRWWLETSLYRLPLPVDWMASAEVPGVLDLMGSDDALVFIRTPDHPPALSELRSAEQQVVSTGRDALSEWVELEYIHEGAEWRQRNQLRRLDGMHILVTAQAPAGAMPAAVAIQHELVGAVQPGGR